MPAIGAGLGGSFGTAGRTPVAPASAAPVEGKHALFSFPTFEPNAIVAPVRAEAMPVLVTTPGGAERWIHALVDAALTSRRPAADDAPPLLATWGDRRRH